MTRRRPPARAFDIGLIASAGAVDLLVWNGDRQLRDGSDLPLWVVPAATVAVMSTLCLRHRNPAAVLWVQCAYAALGGLVVPHYIPFAGVLVALFTVARRCPPAAARTALAACAVPFAINSYTSAAAAAVDLTVGFLTSMLLWTALTGGVWAAGRAGYLADRREERIRERHAAQAREAVQAERLRLARELHDIVSHSVNTMILHAAGARGLPAAEDPGIARSLRLIETSGVEAMTELHRLLRLLRRASGETGPTAEEHRPAPGDLDRLVEKSRSSDLAVELTTRGTVSDLDPSTGVAVYRILQESLTNAAKHTPVPGFAHVRVERSAGRVVVAVDSGPAGPAARPARTGRRLPSGGHGLRGLTERVSLLGGRLDAGPDGDLFRLRAELPAGTADRPEPSPLPAPAGPHQPSEITAPAGDRS